MFQPVRLFGFADVLFVLELGLKLLDDLRRKQWTDFLESVILVPHGLQECRRRLAFVPWKSQFYHESSVEFGVVNGRDAMSFCPFRPPEVGPCRVQDGDEQRGDAQRHRRCLRVFKERCGPCGEKPRDRTDDDDGKVNPRPPHRVECFCPFVTPCQAVRLLTRRGEILLQRRVPGDGDVRRFAHCFSARVSPLPFHLGRFGGSKRGGDPLEKK